MYVLCLSTNIRHTYVDIASRGSDIITVKIYKGPARLLGEVKVEPYTVIPYGKRYVLDPTVVS